MLRRTVVRPGASPDGADSAFVSDRLTALAHELANLLDGSLRCLGLARRAAQINATAAAGPAVPDSDEPDIDLIRRHLDTVHIALQQMAHLVKASMSGFTPGLMAPVNLSLGSCGSLADAVRHAVDVMLPLAQEHRIRVVCDVDPRLADVPAGPVYTVVSSAVRNAVESIQRANEHDSAAWIAGASHRGARSEERGVVHVLARLDDGVTPEQVLIEILDDGEGPPCDAKGNTDALFEFGVSTKPRGTGIGLAVTRDVIHELGGSVTLRHRRQTGRGGADPDPARPGAVLAVRFPCPPSSGG